MNHLIFISAARIDIHENVLPSNYLFMTHKFRRLDQFSWWEKSNLSSDWFCCSLSWAPSLERSEKIENSFRTFNMDLCSTSVLNRSSSQLTETTQLPSIYSIQNVKWSWKKKMRFSLRELKPVLKINISSFTELYPTEWSKFSFSLSNVIINK